MSLENRNVVHAIIFIEHRNHQEGLSTHNLLAPSRFSFWGRIWNCIGNKLPGDVGAAGLGTTLWEALAWNEKEE